MLSNLSKKREACNLLTNAAVLAYWICIVLKVAFAREKDRPVLPNCRGRRRPASVLPSASGQRSLRTVFCWCILRATVCCTGEGHRASLTLDRVIRGSWASCVEAAQWEVIE